MNRMKHYHLGCGEALQSDWTELRILHKSITEEAAKPKHRRIPRTKPGKQH